MNANKKRKFNLLIIITLLACMVLSLFSFGKTEKNATGLPAESSAEVKLITGEFDTVVTDNDSLYNILGQIKSEYGYENAQDELVLDKIVPNAFGKVYKFSQVKYGINVFGRGVNVSVDDYGKVLSVNGNFLSGISLGIYAILSADDAVNIIIKNYEDALVLFAELEIYSLEADPCLAYNIEATLGDGNYRFFVNAKTGIILQKMQIGSSFSFGGSSVLTTQTDYYGNSQNLYIEKRANGEYYLSDATRNIYMLDNKNYGDNYGNYLQSNNYYKNTTGNFTDLVAVSAFSNIIESFDFYTDEDNIGVSVRGINDSVDYTRDNADSNKEMMVYAYMHYGKNFENAFYLGSTSSQNYISLVFGDGNQNGTLYNPALALDIIGHEYHHALTDYISGLLYQNASGALNEAYSDIFGALIENLDTSDDDFWIVGEDGTPDKKGLRSMKDPKSYGYPDHTDNMYPFSNRPSDINDQGGVHINNSIITHIQYKMWEALPQHFTKENIGKLWYSALGMLSANATFDEFRTILCQAAVQLGWDRSVLQVMYECFADSGIGTTEVYHTVIFKNEGKTISTQTVLDGSAATAPNAPVKSSTAQYDYVFTGWDTGFDCVSSNLTVNAVYSSSLRSYTVTWVIEDKSEAQEYLYGETPVYNGEPFKPSDEQYFYSFTGWDKVIKAVSGDITYTAQFTGNLHYCTVTFISDGQQIDEIEVAYGGTVLDLPEPVKSGYTFSGWYTDESYEESFNENSDVIYNSISLYAKWEESETAGTYINCGTITTGGSIMLIVSIACLAVVVLCRRKSDKNVNKVN